MAKVIVLGCGMVGAAMAMDLVAQGLEVTVADAREAPLAGVRERYGVTTVQADLSDASRLREIVAPFDAVAGALSSSLGFTTLRAMIESGKSYCDISFMAEDAWELDALAKERGVTAVFDCGVAPGIGNLCAGIAARSLDPCERIDIYVGGLPEVRTWPFWYKVPYAPRDVLEIYTRPARLVERGEIVVKDALTEPELLDFDGVGTLEAFNTDGLRSLAYTLGVPWMREKTLRYPGHLDLIRALSASGFLSEQAIELASGPVRPIDLTAALLLPRWAFEEGEADVTVLRVVAEGREGGRRVRRTWELLDRYDAATNLRSMSRTTAFPATIVLGMMARGELRLPGAHPPEALANQPGVAERVLAELEQRGVRVRATSVDL